MYKVAISDLDGTLLGSDHKISSQTKQSIHRWIESGRKFVIATGRHHIEAKSLQDELGEPIYLITSNGARVHNKAGELILEQNLPAEIAQAICDTEFDAEVQINLFTDEQWYANFRVPALDDIGLGKGFDSKIVDLKSLDKSNTIKIFFWAEPEKLQPIYDLLNTRFNKDINLTFSLANCLEVMSAGTNKGSAVEAVLKEKGIAVADSIAFGDGMNDVEMLNFVGKAMLMANSQQALFDALPDAEIALSSEQHGVAAKINQLLG